MSSMTLYDAAEELRTLFDTAEGIEDPQKLAAFEAEMEFAFARALAKVEGFVAFLRHLDSQIDLCDAEIKRIKAHKDRFEKTSERLRDYATRSMQANGVKSLEAPTAKLRLQPNPPAVVIENQRELPWHFLQVEVKMTLEQWSRLLKEAEAFRPAEFDELARLLREIREQNGLTSDTPMKTQIAAALKAGEEVPGAHLKRGVRLVVK